MLLVLLLALSMQTAPAPSVPVSKAKPAVAPATLDAGKYANTPFQKKTGVPASEGGSSQVVATKPGNQASSGDDGADAKNAQKHKQAITDALNKVASDKKNGCGTTPC